MGLILPLPLTWFLLTLAHKRGFTWERIVRDLFGIALGGLAFLPITAGLAWAGAAATHGSGSGSFIGDMSGLIGLFFGVVAGVVAWPPASLWLAEGNEVGLPRASHGGALFGSVAATVGVGLGAAGLSASGIGDQGAWTWLLAGLLLLTPAGALAAMAVFARQETGNSKARERRGPMPAQPARGEEPLGASPFRDPISERTSPLRDPRIAVMRARQEQRSTLRASMLVWGLTFIVLAVLFGTVWVVRTGGIRGHLEPIANRLEALRRLRAQTDPCADPQKRRLRTYHGVMCDDGRPAGHRWQAEGNNCVWADLPCR